MFRQRGKNRTLIHNIRIAALLSFVAGMVNITGFLSVQTLTTNVTGHFAYFSEGVLIHDYHKAWSYLLYILFFLLGAITSGLLVETVNRKNSRFVYAIPAMFEIAILVSVGLLSHHFIIKNPEIIACSLLFAMGLQNALVTGISNSAVRTTHLTGLFTDMGIELSQLFFYRKPEQLKKLHASITLRLVIIGFFFLGCFGGGYSYDKFEMLSLLLAAAVLVIGLFYDIMRVNILNLFKKMFS